MFFKYFGKLLLWNICFLFVISDSYSQIANEMNGMIWTQQETCIKTDTNPEIFVVVENPPIILNFTEKQLTNEFSNIIDNSFNKNVKEINYKLKVNLFTEGQSCIYKYGIDNIENKDLEFIKSLNTFFQKNLTFESGRQRTRQVNCQFIIYLKTNNGKLVSTQFKNVNFKS